MFANGVVHKWCEKIYEFGVRIFMDLGSVFKVQNMNDLLNCTF